MRNLAPENAACEGLPPSVICRRCTDTRNTADATGADHSLQAVRLRRVECEDEGRSSKCWCRVRPCLSRQPHGCCRQARRYPVHAAFSCVRRGTPGHAAQCNCSQQQAELRKVDHLQSRGLYFPYSRSSSENLCPLNYLLHRSAGSPLKRRKKVLWVRRCLVPHSN